MKEQIEEALRVLQKGGTILYPTDTIWGIGCDATNAEAVSRIYEIKQRSDSHSMLVLVDTGNRLSAYIDTVPEVAYELLEAATEPLTIIYPGARNLAPNLVASDGSIGMRVTSDEFCRRLITRFRKPIVSTSANISGQPSPVSFYDIGDEIIEAVDHVVDWRQEEPGSGKASSIIKLEVNGTFKILRK